MREAGITEKEDKPQFKGTGASALFNAGAPEKLIRDVTGHRSNALQLYERPTLQQRQSVSSVLIRGKQRFDQGQENVPVPVAHAPSVVKSDVFGSLFSGVTKCNVTFSPQNFTVNVCSSSISQPLSEPEPDLQGLLDGLDLGPLMQQLFYYIYSGHNYNYMHTVK